MILTGDYRKIYARFVERNASPDRHRGHVVNDCYPEKDPNAPVKVIPYEAYVRGITARGMDSFAANGPRIVVDTTEFDKVCMAEVLKKIDGCRKGILQK